MKHDTGKELFPGGKWGDMSAKEYLEGVLESIDVSAFPPLHFPVYPTYRSDLFYLTGCMTDVILDAL